MKAKLKIPKGWRRMRANEIIRKGDKFWSAGDWYKSLNWMGEIRRAGEHTGATYIRKSTPKKKGKT